MNQTFDWIRNNSNWIFSGIGVAVLLLILDIFRNRKTKTKEKLKNIERIAKEYVDVLNHKNRGHSGIPGLIELGAAKLERNKDVIKLCEKIEKFGKPNPLNQWILKHIDKKQILKFIKWQYDNKIGYSPSYFNENNFIALVKRFKNETQK